MKRSFCLILILTTLLMAFPARSAQAADPPLPVVQCQTNGGTPVMFGIDPDKPYELNGSFTCLWVPLSGWNGDLVIFAHGYMDPADPLSIPLDQLALTTPSLPELVVKMGYAFAVPTYSKNGLAVLEGVQAVEELAGFAKTGLPGLQKIYLVGASEGGLVTAKAIEDNPLNIFQGGMSACGPIGDFNGQINYWGDFRVLFDYFFQMIPLANTPVNINPLTIAAWKVGIVPPPPDPGSLQYLVGAALAANPVQTQQLMAVSKAPFDPANLLTVGQSVLGILDYNMKATNEARMELAGSTSIDLSTNAGQPFDNSTRVYAGSLNDTLMNQWITDNNHRFTQDASLIPVLLNYQTSGMIKAPLVTIHTTGDPIVPYWHEVMYQAKIKAAGKSSQAFNIPIMRYGHCAFNAKEAVFAFSTMIHKSTGALPPGMLTWLSQAEYFEFIRLYGTKSFMVKVSR